MNQWNLGAQVRNYNVNTSRTEEGTDMGISYLEFSCQADSFAEAVKKCMTDGIFVKDNDGLDWFPPHTIVRIWEAK